MKVIKNIYYILNILTASTLVYRLKKNSSQIINQILRQLPPKVSDAQLSNSDIIFMILVASIKIWLQTASLPEHRVHFAIFLTVHQSTLYLRGLLIILYCDWWWLISSFLL